MISLNQHRSWTGEKLICSHKFVLSPAKQHRPNKALHPTAYSFVPFARSSLRSLRFRRRVSLVVVWQRAALCSCALLSTPVADTWLRVLQVLASVFLWLMRFCSRATFWVSAWRGLFSLAQLLASTWRSVSGLAQLLGFGS